MKSVIKYKGLYKFYSDRSGQMKQIDEVENILTDVLLDRIILSLKGLNPVTYSDGIDIRQFAIGTSTTAPAASDTILGNEVYRVPKTAQTLTGTGELTTEFYITDNGYTGPIEEIGIFGGSLAYDWTDGIHTFAGWGTLLSRALWSYTKLDSEQIVIQRIDKFVRG